MDAELFQSKRTDFKERDYFKHLQKQKKMKKQGPSFGGTFKNY